MRLIDADKIDYYTLERDGKTIGQMVWKPHIDGMPTISIKEIREQAFQELRNKVILYVKEHGSSTICQDLNNIIDDIQKNDEVQLKK